MVIKREIAYGIVRGLSEFWNREEFQDFTVTVGETNFGCHKLLLAACSAFFRGIFRSGMKETKLNSVVLEDISSETFELVLKTIYTGSCFLTDDNVIDIWRAVNQLQVTFMITECEMFVLKSLSMLNFAEYFYYGKLLSSQIVTETAWNFALKHCDSFFKTSYFLMLPINDVLSLIKSQDLATSNEDEVLNAIFKWVGYKPHKTSCSQVCKEITQTISSEIKNIKHDIDSNIKDINILTAVYQKNKTTDIRICVSCDTNVPCENGVPSEECAPRDETGSYEGTLTESDNRTKYLFELVSNTRACLASHGCLEMFLSHPLVYENIQVRDVITRAILYQLQISKRNGQWPTGATHRNKSVFENVAITFSSEYKLMVYSFSRNIWNEYKVSTLFHHDVILQMVTVDKSLYCLCVGYDDDKNVHECNLLIFLLADSRKWELLDDVPKMILRKAIFSVLAVNECIYIVQRNKFWKVNPSLQTSVTLCDLPVEEDICHLTLCDKKILAFCSTSLQAGVSETAVLCFDLSNNTWTRLNNLEGPADGMTSFKDDHSTYLLQSNGDMWKLVKPMSDVIDFELVVKLWRCDWPLYGAVNFLDKLYIYGADSGSISDDPLRLKSVTGLLKKIIYLQSLGSCNIKPMFVPFIADRRWIKRK